MQQLTPLDYVLLYLVFFNSLVFILFAIDYRRRKKKQPRLSPKVLFIPAALGGALFGTISVYLFHSYERKYSVGFPLLVAAHILILYFLLPCVVPM